MFRNDDFEIDTLSEQGHTTLSQYITKTFVTVAVGILITALTAYFMSIDYLSLRMIYQNKNLPMLFMALQIGCLLLFRFRLFKASLLMTRLMFLIYSVLLGFTFSFVQYVFAIEAVYLAFGIGFVYFVSLCVIGYTTRIDLMKYQTILLTGLFFLVGFNVLCIFIDISHAEQIACSCSLIIFTLLTALDMKKLKHFYFEYQEDEVRLAQLSMYSALQLYLDFLNLIYTITHILNGFGKK